MFVLNIVCETMIVRCELVQPDSLGDCVGGGMQEGWWVGGIWENLGMYIRAG